MRPISGTTGAVVRRALGAARPRPDEDRGAVAILVAAMLTVFLGLCALVVDRGLADDTERQAQAASDASALAAAVVLFRGGLPTDADAAARAYALADFGVTPADWSSCSTTLDPGFSPLGGTSCISYDAGTQAVRVALPARDVPSIFGSIFGVTSRTVTSAATAGYGGPGTGCVVCIMGSLAGKDGEIVASGGNVYAKDISFNPNLVGGISVTGGTIGYSGTRTGGGAFSPAPPALTASAQDPYAGIPQPTVDSSRVAVAGSGPCDPSHYYYDISGCTSFAPGVYVLLGTDEHIEDVTASDVMFFLTCSTTTGTRRAPVITAHLCDPRGEAGANFGGAGRTGVTLTGRSSDPVYKGFALWVDRNNTTAQTWTGNADFTVVGTSYSVNPAGLDSTRGNGEMTVVQGTMVLGSLQMRGNHVHVDVSGTGSTAGGGVTPALPHLSR